MPKINYFDSLERLALLASRAVFLACRDSLLRSHGELASLRGSADGLVCELEKSLFCDFMTPLERSNIAACAHSLCRILERCADIVNYRSTKGLLCDKDNREPEKCISLMQMLEENVFRLRRIKKPEELPDLVGFRKLLCEARVAHSAMQKRYNSGGFPRSCLHLLSLFGRLRCELSRCFDELVEIMLNNI